MSNLSKMATYPLSEVRNLYLHYLQYITSTSSEPMNIQQSKLPTRKVEYYDGRAIFYSDEHYYQLGSYLGGGAAGVVYEAYCTHTKRHVAIKILNPVGYKLIPASLSARCVVVVEGEPLKLSGCSSSQVQVYSTSNNYSDNLLKYSPLSIENVWWLIHPTSKQAIAAFQDPDTNCMRELTLPQCISIWGTSFDTNAMATAYQEIIIKQTTIRLPIIPKKFVNFVITYSSIRREIANMSNLEHHINVLRLEESLELLEDSKCTTFLVLELAVGGELFDRIKLDCGTDEETARHYFRQLIAGVACCHASSICHRDLKPENLLLADNEALSVLKIADFGLSAIFELTEQESLEKLLSPNLSITNRAQDNAIRTRRLRSIVGSPHYVAPEVLDDDGHGYDGAKADAWSVGVILYAMLAGNLPFGKDLLRCIRYEKFKTWSYNTKYDEDTAQQHDPIDNDVDGGNHVEDCDVQFPSWFFPVGLTGGVKSLIAQLLYPDACLRLSVQEAQHHPWVTNKGKPNTQLYKSENSYSDLATPSPIYDTEKNLIDNKHDYTLGEDYTNLGLCNNDKIKD